MPIYEQTPIRLQATLVNPPVNPLDANTGAQPRFWRRSNVSIAVGIFDAFDVPVDLTNLTKLQLFLFKTEEDLVPLVTKEVLAAAIYPLITALGWAQGTQQNATFALTQGDTDQSLGGGSQSDFWMVLNGVSASGEILYCAGPCTIFNAANALPASALPTPSFHRQTNSAGDSTVTPTSNLHTEEVTIAGAGSRTSNIIVGQAGLSAGALIELLLLAPGAAAAIDVQIFVGSLLGPNPFAFNTSGGTTRCLFRFYFDGVNLQPLEQVNPAF